MPPRSNPERPSQKSKEKLKNTLYEPTEIPADLQGTTLHNLATLNPQCSALLSKHVSSRGSSSSPMIRPLKTYFSQCSNVKLRVKTVGLALPGLTNTF